MIGYQTRIVSNVQEFYGRSSNKSKSHLKFESHLHVDNSHSSSIQQQQKSIQSFSTVTNCVSNIGVASVDLGSFNGLQNHRNEAFVSNHDVVQLAAHMAQRFWDFGLPCELLTESDLVSELCKICLFILFNFFYNFKLTHLNYYYFST